MQPELEIKQAQLRVAKAISSLLQDERWQAFSQSMTQAREAVIWRLATQQLGEREIGFHQASYAFYSMICQKPETNQESIQRLEAEIAGLELVDQKSKLLDAAYPPTGLPEGRVEELLSEIQRLEAQGEPHDRQEPA